MHNLSSTRRVSSFILNSFAAYAAIAIVLASTSHAQTLEWFRTVNIGLGNRGVGVTVDATGAAYISGETNTAGTKQAYITRYDYAGNNAWFEALGQGVFDGTRGIGSPSADGLGNIYMAGRTRDALDPPTDVPGSTDAFVAKYSDSGVLEWTRQVGTERDDFGTGVFADTAGSVYLTGWTAGKLADPNAVSTDVFLSRFDSSGILQWSRQMGSDREEQPLDLTGDELGNTYVAGYTFGDFGGENAGNKDGFVSSYDVEGNHRWTKQFGTDSLDEARGISSDGLGHIYVTGRTDGSLVSGVVNSNSDAFLQQYDTDGNLLWTRHFLGDETDPFASTRGVAADRYGNVYVTGNSIGGLPGDLGIAEGDAFLAKFDSTGELHWSTRFGGAEDLTHISWDITVDNLGNIFLAGDDVDNGGFAFLYRFKDQAVIPEPSSLLLFAAGIAVVIVRRKRLVAV